MQFVERTILRYRDDAVQASRDSILAEMPLEIVVNGVQWAALMCTPGNDEALAVGYCLTEGLIGPAETYSLESHQHLDGVNRIALSIAGGALRVETALKGRGQRMGVSCSGNRSAVCADDLIKPVRMAGTGYATTPAQLHRLQQESEACQALFATTGATHFCALYDDNGTMLAYAEDVGRHNALDKAAGEAFRCGCVASARLVMLSSRLSFEMVQKSIALGAQVVCGFSAVTSRAVTLADAAGLTLVGFLRSSRLNVYTHPHRLGLTDPAAPVSDRAGCRASEKQV